jgi:deoxyribonuclease-4
MGKLRFGTGGIPHSSQPETIEGGIGRINELGLGCMELEFVRSVFVTADHAPVVKKLARSKDVALTVHASYFINLASLENPKVHASIQRILQSARIGHLCGAKSVTFHAAFFQKRAPSLVFKKVKKCLEQIVETLKEEGNDILIRPELTGKPSQFGSLEELIKLSSQVEQVLPCIDFAHLHARKGKYNTKPEFRSALEALEKGLGKEILKNMHAHIAGIEYSKKGERRHLNLEESDLDFTSLMELFREFNLEGFIVCESPNLEEDAILLKSAFDRS